MVLILICDSSGRDSYADKLQIIEVKGYYDSSKVISIIVEKFSDPMNYS